MRSYKEHYETSMNNLIEDFETNLDISPILPNKAISRIQKYDSEEKEIETFPQFPLETSTETDEIPRIKELQHHEYHGIIILYLYLINIISIQQSQHLHVTHR